MIAVAENVMLTLLFLACVLIVYYVTPRKSRYLVLALSGALFYASAQPLFLLLIAGSGLWTYFAGSKIASANKEDKELHKGKKWMLAGVLPLLAVLLYFKYLNFFVSSVEALLRSIGLPCGELTLQLLLPLGISYYTFKLISYLADVYKGKLEPETHLGYFMAYVLFFPQILSGPIERAEHMLQKLREPAYDPVLFQRGMQRIILGLFKKMVIANRLAAYVDLVFGDAGAYPALAAWMAACFYTIQLYCDFSGYSDLALGMSDLMGISCRENFRMPYFSNDIREFWTRWHISLSSWLRDYVYIPLGGSRCAPWRRKLNVVITFLVSGLWHGANWTFVLWGLIQGIWNAVGQKKEEAKNVLIRVFRSVCLFLLLVLSFVIFRADSIRTAGRFYVHMVKDFSLSADIITASILPFTGDNTCAAMFLTVCLMIFILFLYEVRGYRLEGALPDEEKEMLVSRRAILWTALFALCIVLFGVFGISGFLYANF